MHEARPAVSVTETAVTQVVRGLSSLATVAGVDVRVVVVAVVATLGPVHVAVLPRIAHGDEQVVVRISVGVAVVVREATLASVAPLVGVVGVDHEAVAVDHGPSAAVYVPVPGLDVAPLVVEGHRGLLAALELGELVEDQLERYAVRVGQDIELAVLDGEIHDAPVLDATVRVADGRAFDAHPAPVDHDGRHGRGQELDALEVADVDRDLFDRDPLAATADRVEGAADVQRVTDVGREARQGRVELDGRTRCGVEPHIAVLMHERFAVVLGLLFGRGGDGDVDVDVGLVALHGDVVHIGGVAGPEEGGRDDEGQGVGLGHGGLLLVLPVKAWLTF